MSTPVWTGTLDLGELQFGIRFLTGPRTESIAFKQIHQCPGAETPSPVKQLLHCQAENKTIPRAEVARGFQQIKNGPLIPVEESALAALLPQPIDTLQVLTVLPALPGNGFVDPLYFESSYYVHPEADSELAYAAALKALRESGRTILTQVVLQKRRRFLLIRPGPTSLLAHTLYFEREARRLEEFRTDTSLAPLELWRPLARKLKSSKGALEPLVDEYRPQILDVLQATADKRTPAGPLYDPETTEAMSKAAEKASDRASDKATDKNSPERKPPAVESVQNRGRKAKRTADKPPAKSS